MSWSTAHSLLECFFLLAVWDEPNPDWPDVSFSCWLLCYHCSFSWLDR